MKPTRNMMAALLMLTLMAAGLFAIGPEALHAAPIAKKKTLVLKNQDVLVNQLIRLSGADEELKRIVSNLRLLSKDLEEAGLPPEIVLATKHIIEKNIDLDSFTRLVKEHLGKHYDRKAAKASIQWFRKPVWEKIRKMEVEATTTEAEREFQIYTEWLNAFPPEEERANLVERLENAWNLTEFVIESPLPIIRLWVTFSKKFSGGSPRFIIKTLKEEHGESIRESVLRSLLYTYRDLSSEELREYVEFAESKPGRWFSKVWQEGLYNAYEEQIDRGRSRLERLITRIESKDGGLDILKETFPPGERYVVLRRRDPFLPLVDESKGVRQVERKKPVRALEKMEKELAELKTMPPIPLEIYKKIRDQEPEFYADLEYYGRLFQDQRRLKRMEEDELLDALENYEILLEKANRRQEERVEKTPLQTDYSSLKLVGVIWKNGESIALMETEDRRGHSVRRGALMGPNYGVVESIESDQVTVVERFRDYAGEILANKKRITFSGEISESPEGG